MFDYLEQLLLIFRCNKDVVECLEKINYLSAMQPKYIQMKWYHIKKLENGLGHPGSPWRVGEELGAEVRGVELKAAEASAPGETIANPLWYSCLENPRDRRAWLATVHRVAKSRTCLKWLSTHAHLKSFRQETEFNIKFIWLQSCVSCIDEWG